MFGISLGGKKPETNLTSVTGDPGTGGMLGSKRIEVGGDSPKSQSLERVQLLSKELENAICELPDDQDILEILRKEVDDKKRTIQSAKSEEDVEGGDELAVDWQAMLTEISMLSERSSAFLSGLEKCKEVPNCKDLEELASIARSSGRIVSLTGEKAWIDGNEVAENILSFLTTARNAGDAKMNRQIFEILANNSIPRAHGFRETFLRLGKDFVAQEESEVSAEARISAENSNRSLVLEIEAAGERYQELLKLAQESLKDIMAEFQKMIEAGNLKEGEAKIVAEIALKVVLREIEMKEVIVREVLGGNEEQFENLLEKIVAEVN